VFHAGLRNQSRTKNNGKKRGGRDGYSIYEKNLQGHDEKGKVVWENLKMRTSKNDRILQEIPVLEGKRGEGGERRVLDVGLWERMKRVFTEQGEVIESRASFNYKRKRELELQRVEDTG